MELAFLSLAAPSQKVCLFSILSPFSPFSLASGPGKIILGIPASTSFLSQQHRNIW